MENGISRITALWIQESKSVYSYTGQHRETLKWAGFIEAMDAKNRPRLLVSSEEEGTRNHLVRAASVEACIEA